MDNITVTNVPAGSQLIDVREPDEFATVHAVGSKNIPLSEFIQRTVEIDPDEPIYLICAAGGRSAQAGQYLEQALGYDEVFNVDGGIFAWVDADLPTE